MSYSDDTILALSGHELPVEQHRIPVRLLTDYTDDEPSERSKELETEKLEKLGWEITEIRVTAGAGWKTDYYGYKNRRQS